LLTSFKPEAELLRVPPLLPSRLTLAHYQVVIAQSLMPRALGNSLGIATLTTLLSLAAGVPAAYAVARLPLPGKRLLLLAIVASTAFPQIATVSPLYLLMRALGLRGEPDDPGGARVVSRRLRGAVGRYRRGVDAREPSAGRDRHRAAALPGPGPGRRRRQGVSYYEGGHDHDRLLA